MYALTGIQGEYAMNVGYITWHFYKIYETNVNKEYISKNFKYVFKTRCLKMSWTEQYPVPLSAWH